MPHLLLARCTAAGPLLFLVITRSPPERRTMPHYTAPLRDMQFVLHEVFKVADELKVLPRHPEIDMETINAVLEEGGKFASEVIFPLNSSGDEQGCKLDQTTHEVTPPQGFKNAYAQYVQSGWPALSCAPEYGGQGLPFVVNQCFYEMLNSANQAWAMYPGLSHGAYECLHAHGTDAQKKLYLPKLTSGEWSGTMCLTEAHCGTDLGLLRTKAIPCEDAQTEGSYKLTGNKIFISAGEHDLTGNILHLVLARLPDAPPGSQGISLFLVPKFNVNEDGSLGARNAIYCSGLERKMGIHGNATCQMVLDGAVGTLVGEPHKGLAAMFVMMNMARLGVGNQSLGLSEVAYQNALAYAKDRIQMRSLSGVKAKDKPADPIIVHPDVRRMLLTAKAYAEGGRALAVYCALLLDQEIDHPDEKVRQDAAELVALLTPIVKAFLTDNGHIATNACLQVFGGHGYIKESGMEQLARDNRINMIYEGTNAIQSLDLLGRKVLGNQGATLKKFGRLISALIAEEGVNEKMDEFISPLAALAEQMTKLTTELGFRASQNPDEVGAAAVDYLRVAGHLVFAYLWARMAQVALREIAAGNADSFYQAKVQTARFYFARLLPETASLMRTARSGSRALMDTEAALA
jgi:alkylation response protein AidB-like acyl-CoA dehydrogenase